MFRIVAVGIACVMCVLVLSPKPAAAGPRDLGRDPPPVQRGWMEAGPNGSTLLKVTFVDPDSAGIKDRVVITPEPGQRYELRDDGVAPDEKAGDRLFTAQVDDKFAGLQTAQFAMLRRLSAVEKRQPGALQQRLALRQRGRLKTARPSRADVAELMQIMRSLPDRADRLARLPLFGVADVDAIDVRKSLMITDLHVIQDPARTFNPCAGVAPADAGTPNGKWTFGFLMRQLCANAPDNLDPRLFVDNWLRQLELDQNVNGFVITGRTGVAQRIRAQWPVDSDGLLDLDRAPFRLLAIVNRVDLRGNLVYGGSAGEARFVFGAINLANCQSLEMGVIFEYGVPRSGCRAVKRWAKRWADLSQHDLSIPAERQAYLTALEALTDDFSLAGKAPDKPNESPLNQLRTNEFLLFGGNGERWELREFLLSASGWDTGFLRIDTCKNEADGTHNRTQRLGRFIDTMPTTPGAGAPPVPLYWENERFLAGNAITPPIIGGSWEGDQSLRPPSNTPQLVDYANRRFNFALNTCSGCHQNETSTSFYHVRPAPFGQEPTLSSFLKGDGAGGPFIVPDPLNNEGAPLREFNDLARRRQDLADLLAAPCIGHIGFIPLRMVH